MATTSTLARSKKELERLGYDVAITERWNSFAHIRQDFGGFGDALAWHMEAPGVLAINATTNGHLSDHIQKYLPMQNLKRWLIAGNRFEIWCWAKRGDRGKRKLWTLKRVEMKLTDFHDLHQSLPGLVGTSNQEISPQQAI